MRKRSRGEITLKDNLAIIALMNNRVVEKKEKLNPKKRIYRHFLKCQLLVQAAVKTALRMLQNIILYTFVPYLRRIKIE